MQEDRSQSSGESQQESLTSRGPLSPREGEASQQGDGRGTSLGCAAPQAITGASSRHGGYENCWWTHPKAPDRADGKVARAGGHQDGVVTRYSLRQ